MKYSIKLVIALLVVIVITIPTNSIFSQCDDTAAPVAICKQSVVLVTNGGSASLSVLDVDDGSYDDCGIQCMILADASTGGNVGVFDCDDANSGNPPTIVHLFVTDKAGNTGMCQTEVTVVNIITAECNPPFSRSLDANGMASILIPEAGIGYTTGCPGYFTASPRDFDCSDIGPNIVTLTASDTLGNVDMCTTTVTIIDDESPTCQTQPLLFIMPMSGMIEIVPSTPLLGFPEDNCGVADISIDKNIFTCSDIGINVVTVTVADESGNTGTCSNTIEVQDPNNYCPTPQGAPAGKTRNHNATMSLNGPFYYEINSKKTINKEEIVEAQHKDNNINYKSAPVTAGCYNLDIILEPSLSVLISVSEVDSFSFSDAGIKVLCLDQVYFDCGDIGENIVTLVVVDNEGDTSSCTSIVTVSENPTVACCGDNNCLIQCHSQINVSLDQTCEAEITPSMGGVGIPYYCNDFYSIQVFDQYDNVIPDNTVDLYHLDQNLKFEITEPECNNKCWGYVNVEYKLPPQIICPDSDTLTCGEFALLDVPEAIGGCAGFEVSLINEQSFPIDCDPDVTRRVIRTYEAVDSYGNSSTCTDTIIIRRVDLDAIEYPLSLTVGTGNAISCNDSIYEFDLNGIPLPWPTDPTTGSGTGVPVICDPTIVDGVLCPSTGDLTGAPLIPGINPLICNSLVSYTDIELPKIGCLRKIMRTWEVREWWCNQELEDSGFQLIEIVDDEAPDYICPADFTVSTGYDCAGNVNLPAISAQDECDHGVIVRIDYPNGFLESNGGMAELDLGLNMVHYIVSDSCYNSSSCTVDVMVVDETEPVAICESFKVVSLSNSGQTIVFAEPFDNGSWDECHLDRFEVRRMDTICVAADTLFDESVTFCCQDVGREVMVVFRAYDFAQNYNDCMVRVEVQDKSVPVITCPDNVTIDCRDPYDINNLALTFGDLIVEHNCSGLNWIDETVTPDLTQCGTGTIARKFELKDDNDIVLRSCKQTISIINEIPFVASNIQWPLDYEMVGGCSIDDLDPQHLPEFFDFPTFLAGDDQCSLLGYDYEDQVFEPQPGSGECVHIERTWSVIDWCSSVNGSFEIYVIPQPQIITLTNDVRPEIVDQDDLLFETQNVDCDEAPINVEREAIDDCNNPLYWTYVIRDEDDDIVRQGSSNIIIDSLDNGIYTIDWTVQDGCGNFDYDIQGLEVRNTKTPSPVCISGLSANLVPMDLDNDGVPESEMVELWASDFDAKSYHNCGNPIVLSLSSDTTIRNVIYDCDDIGINTVQLWVTDVITGAQDYCQTFIDIQDNNNLDVCDTLDGMRVVIEGDIYTEYFEEIEGVEVNLGIPDLDTETNTTGNYAFGAMNPGGSYTIIPSLDKEDLNGVSTLDIIIIQKHILGMEQLTSPYQYIAADADNSKSISALDLVELRKLILGINGDLTSNTSWRFIDALYQFVDPMDPWAVDFPEDYLIPNLETDMDIDFIGVKIGDVNGSVIANSELKDQTGEAELIITQKPVTANPGELISIPLTIDNYESIDGWQVSLDYDATEIEVLGLESDLVGFGPEHFHVDRSQASINISYHDVETVRDLSKAKVTVLAKARKPLKNNRALSMRSGQLKAEAYTEGLGIRTLKLLDATAAPGRIISVSPNPFVERATIHFYLPEQTEGTWEYYDVNGRKLYTYTDVFNKGNQTIDITRSDLNASGVIYVRFIGSNFSSEYKMIVL